METIFPPLNVTGQPSKLFLSLFKMFVQNKQCFGQTSSKMEECCRTGFTGNYVALQLGIAFQF